MYGAIEIGKKYPQIVSKLFIAVNCTVHLFTSCHQSIPPCCSVRGSLIYLLARVVKKELLLVNYPPCEQTLEFTKYLHILGIQLIAELET